MELKTCYVCRIDKQIDLFRKGKNKCLECHKKYMNEYYQKNRDTILNQMQINSNKKIDGVKMCVECSIEYDTSFFTQNRNQCNDCRKKRNQEYYLNNKNNILKTQKKYILNNKEKIKTYQENNKETKKEYMKMYYQNNKEKINKQKENYSKNRKLIDPLYKLKFNIRRSINSIFRFKGYKKNNKTENILGCKFEEFKIHLESKFEPWMSWDNYGLYNGQLNYGWDIDHIIPMAIAKSENEIIKLNHYTNLQPLCSYINRNVKKDKLL